MIFTKSGIEFEHQRKIREINEETKEIKGDGYRSEFKRTKFLAGEKDLSEELIRFLIDESTETKSDPEVGKLVITGKKIDKYVDDFKNKRKETEEYTKALTFLRAYFDESNKKKIDL